MCQLQEEQEGKRESAPPARVYCKRKFHECDDDQEDEKNESCDAAPVPRRFICATRRTRVRTSIFVSSTEIYKFNQDAFSFGSTIRIVKS